jgi:hypothetical protein
MGAVICSADDGWVEHFWSYAMKSFLERHQEQLVGVLSGFDRIRFSGSLRSLSYLKGFDKFLGAMGVLYKDFGKFAERVSERIKAHAHAFAERHGRPLMYLESSRVSKEEIARRVAERDGVTRGLVCVLSCVEPCRTYTVCRNRETKSLKLASTQRKCLFLYFYFLDREFGLMHVRLQTWLPMTIQVCLNGREYLARRLAQAGVGHEQRDNCFTRIDDLPRAQRMLDELEKRNWVGFLDAFARRLNPWMSGEHPLDRRVTRNGERTTTWIPMRKSVADIRRRAELSRAANERYFEALGVVGDSSPTRTLTDPVSRRIIRDGRPYRALRPIDPEEARLFSLLVDGKFLLQGFRKRDLRERLMPHVGKTPHERRRASSRISGLLRLLRAHALIRKVSTTPYYRVTPHGQHLMTTVLLLRELTVHAIAA